MSSRSGGHGCLSGLLLATLGSQLGCVGVAIVLVIAAVALLLFLKIAIQVAKLAVGVGGLYGAVIAVRNYLRALSANVRPGEV